MEVKTDLLVTYNEEEGTCFRPSLKYDVQRYAEHIGVKDLPINSLGITDKDARFELVRYWSVLFGLIEKIERGDYDAEG